MNDADSMVSQLETRNTQPATLTLPLQLEAMPPLADHHATKLARARRAKAIRESLEIDQDEMARRLTETAARLGFDYIRYDKSKVSKSENAGRDINAEDALIWAEMDPEKRGVPWFVAGLLADRGDGHRRGGDSRRRA